MKKLYEKGKAFLLRIGAYEVSLYAANASFYMILALFPSVMLLVCLLPYVGYSQTDLLNLFTDLVPSVLYPLLERLIGDVSTNSTSALLSVTALVAVWSASSGVYCIQLGLNAIYDVRESRSYLHRRLSCMLYMVLLLLALLLTLVLHGFGREIAAFCEGKSIPILRWTAKLLRFRSLIVLVLLTALFTAFYCILPNLRVRIGAALPGAFLAALGWLVFTNGFSYYIRAFSSYSALYGSLSIIAVGMLWLYICISILFYGCVLNLHLRKKDAHGKP